MTQPKAPRISIVLPVYNGEKTIKATVVSLLNQTYQDFELLVCIDGTNDQSEEILKTIDDPRLIVIKNPVNLGLGRTLNRLIAKTVPESEYIAMAEQDDWYYPDRLEAQIEFLDKNPKYGLVSGITEHWTGKSVSVQLPSFLVRGGQYPSEYEDCFLFLFNGLNSLVQTCMMFRKEVYINNGLYFSAHYPTMPVDWDFALRFCKFAPLYGLHKALVRQGREPDRVSVSKDIRLTYTSCSELIRSFRYECRSIISDRDYKNARVKLKIREIANYGLYKRWRILLLLLFLERHPFVFERFGFEFRRFFNGYHKRGNGKFIFNLKY